MVLDKALGELLHDMLETETLGGGMASALVLMPERWLPDSITELARHFTSRGLTGICVSFGLPHTTLMARFQSADVDQSRVLFIDASGTKNQEPQENALHIDPEGLLDITVTIAQFAQSTPGQHFIIIDDLRALRKRHPEALALRFISDLSRQSARLRMRCIALLGRDAAFADFQRAAAPFFGRVIELG